MKLALTVKNIALKIHNDQVVEKEYPHMAHVLDLASLIANLGESCETVGSLLDAIEDASPSKFQTEAFAKINATLSGQCWLSYIET